MSLNANTRADRQIRRLHAKTTFYFQRAKLMFDSINEVSINEAKKREFLLNAAGIDHIRAEYVCYLDEKIDAELEAYPDREPDYSELNVFEDMYSQIKRTVVTHDTSAQGTAPKSPAGTRTPRLVKLPELHLHSFDGSPENWSIFYETFKSVIHLNTSLSDSEKIQYLVGQLSGKALNLCRGMAPTANNYTALWNALCNKYNDKQALAGTYLDQLLKISTVTSATPASLEGFVDKYTTAISSLKQLQLEDLTEFIFVHVGLKKLDIETVRSFEMSLRNQTAPPTSTQLINFVLEQFRILSRANSITQSSRSTKTNQSSVHNVHRDTPKTFINIQSNKTACSHCQDKVHTIYRCPKFNALSPQERYHQIKSKRGCINCLSDRHSTRVCKSTNKCRFCSHNHHSLLHFNANPQSTTPSSLSASANCNNVTNNNASASSVVTDNNASASLVSLCVTNSNSPATTKTVAAHTHSSMLLGTALCNTLDSNGHLQTVRVLLDSGSQKDIITRSCCSRLNLPVLPSRNSHVAGLGDVVNRIQGTTSLKLSSRINKDVSFNIQPYVVNRITSSLPSALVDVNALSHLHNLPLADDTYGKPGDIDIILGCQIFTSILLSNKVSRLPHEPVAIETLLGYLVLGNAPILPLENHNVVRSYCTFAGDEDACLSRFFDLEDLPRSDFLTPDEKECEAIFVETTTRDASGRYVVALPFRGDAGDLGNSRQLAERRFHQLERRLLSNPAIKLEYNSILNDYLQKDYISVVDDNSSPSRYIIPHHAVFRADKLTTKTRMVLDASMKTTSGFSLNDLLHTGRNLQADLFRIILCFRLSAIAVSADIRQMYLQIVVKKDHRKFQRILYRFSETEPLKLYEFNRVTFGMRCSPFLAMRTVRQLASDEKQRFPLASSIIEEGSFYMDDLAISCSTVEDAQEISTQLIQLFAAGGFELVKFSSNSPEFMSSIPANSRTTENTEFGADDKLKILGLNWIPASDNFTFAVQADERNCTKRNILSTIARLWDLMGFVAPVTLLAKLVVRSLWENKLDWDDTPPGTIVTRWKQFVEELPLLQSLKIPRYLGVEPRCVLSLLGFSDASERAYGGVVYLHVFCPDSNRTTVSLLCAKSKVAPVKTVSLARLELCGALILSQLMHTILETYASRCNISHIYAFCDSMVALTWIHSSPAKWQTFVANRVSKIHSNIDFNRFFYIKGIDNSADCLSRGLTPAQLINHPLWFNGPPFIYLPIDDWPILEFDSKQVADPPETKSRILITADNVNNLAQLPLLYNLASRISSWSKLIKIGVYILRFIKRIPANFEQSHLDTSEQAILRSLQQVHFASIFKTVNDGKILPRTFAKLNPFIKDGLLRVGGRLTNSDLDYDSKHPILLPGRDHVVDILIDYYHKKYLHAGPALLMSLLRQKYWIMSARNIVRKRFHLCNICFKTNPKPMFPLMGNLPPCRVREAKPFLHTGVDYAGPLQILLQRRRGARSQKAYICLFVCLVTRAVHIELASDLSTEIFLNAFKRFLSRRGPVGVLYSDCGTNFVGAKSHLRDLYTLVNSPGYNKEFSDNLRENRIEWKMNPPQSPHHGGIWESNIKSVKTHLHKIVANHLLTFEEMLTVLAQIEALLNSRPLSVLSADPSDPLPLTPAHFLTLTPLKSLPAANLAEERVDLLHRKRLIDHLVQSFWNRWRFEYLNTLQSRQKWCTPSNPVTAGTVVVIKCDNVPPLLWPLGIINNTYPGADGIVRVADVRTKTGVYRRAVVKLCPLPTQ